MKTKLIKALLLFKSYSAADLSAFALVVLNAMTGNTFFPTAAALLAELKDAQEEFAAAMINCASGDRKCIAVKNAKRAVLTDVLVRITDLINFVANGNKVMLATTGLVLSSDSSESDKDTLLPSMDIQYCGNGKLSIKAKDIAGYRGIIYQVAMPGSVNEINGEPNWVTIPSTKTSATLQDMPVGKNVLIRIGVWTSKQPAVYTDAVTKMVA